MITAISSLIISVIALAISYLALIYTARPKVRVRVLTAGSLRSTQVVDLSFRVEMRSRLKRAAADMRMYINFTPDVEPISATFGSALELNSTEVRSGKGPSRYVVVTGVRISRDEPVPYEDFVVRAQMPQVPGIYQGWVTCFAHGSGDDCGVSRFRLVVI